MKRIVPLIILLALSLNATATDVTPQEAKAIAAGFLQTRQTSPNGRHNKRKQIGKEQLTVSDASRMVYAVSHAEEGFVLVSKDDAVCQVLGYSDDGPFDGSQLPDAFKEMMGDYDHEITIAAEQARQGNLQAPRRAARNAVAPLITSKWDQGEASETGNVFNWQCPAKFSGLNSCHCVTGCVATAMAQVMYFWQYPQTTQSAIPAYSSNAVSYESLPVTSFDWENMRDEYLGSDLTNLTSNLAEPIGKLMKYCGYAAKMDYGVSGSGASVQDMFSALITYFGYNENAKLAYRQYYSIDAWNNMIYEDLEAGRPVLYSGSSTGGGHQFILDGVDSDGLYHVNWGWGGRCDGYYVLNILNPRSTSNAGASSSSDGYSMNHCAVLGLQPQTTSTANRLTITSIENPGGSFLHGSVFNLTNETVHCGVGLGAIADDGNVTPLSVYHPSQLPNGLSPNSGKGVSLFFKYIPDDLGDGTFRISGIYSTDDTNWYACEGSDLTYAMVTVEGDKMTNCTIYPITCDVTVSDGRLTGDGYVNVPQEVEVTFQNQTDSEYSGVVGLFLSDGSNLVTLSGLYLKANSSDKTYFYYTPTSTGSRTLYLYEVDPETGSTIRKLGEITVNITYGPDGEIEATLSIDGAVNQGGVNYVNSASAELDINIYNNTNTTDYGFILLKYVESNAWLTGWRLGVSPHMSQTLTYQLEGLEEGTTHTYEVYYNTSASTSGAQLLSSYSFVVGHNSSVEKEDQTLSMSPIPTMTYGTDSSYPLPAKTDQNLTITWTSNNNSVATVSGNTLTVTGAGTATITATQGGNEEYNQFVRQFPLTVNKAEQNISLTEIPTLTYGTDSSYSLPAETEQGLPITWTSDNNSVATVSGNTLTVIGVGTATIAATQVGNNNYNPLDKSFTLTVADRKENQTIRISMIEIVYGVQQGKALINKTEQGLPITLTCSDSSVAIITDCKIWVKGAGTATITATNDGDATYNPFTKSINLTVKQAPLTITAINKSKTYGHENPTLTVSYSGFFYDEDASVLTTQPQITTTADINSSVGTYPITVSGAEAANYYIKRYDSGTLTVNKAALTITADNKTKTAGEANPDLTVSYDGFMNGETASVLTKQPTVTTTATNNSPVGTYPITVTGADAKNYNITYVNGTLEIVEGCTPGDVNGDGEINGFDLVYMVDIIMGDTSVTYEMSATDLDGDGDVNGFDLVELVDLILSQPVSGAKARRSPEILSPALNASMLISRNTDGSFSVGVDSKDSFILSQFVLELSEGQRLTDITASDNHHVVAYRMVDENKYAVICYSSSNQVFTENKDMLTFSCEGEGAICVSDIMLVNTNKKQIRAGNAELFETTGIDIVNGSFSKPSDIYSISGTLVRRNAKSISGIEKGIYIIGRKTVYVK